MEKICRFSGIAFFAARPSETTHPKLRLLLEQARQAEIKGTILKRLAFVRKLGITDIDVFVQFGTSGRAEDLQQAYQIVQLSDGTIQAHSPVAQEPIADTPSEPRQPRSPILHQREQFYVGLWETYELWQRTRRAIHGIHTEMERSQHLHETIQEHLAFDPRHVIQSYLKDVTTENVSTPHPLRHDMT